MRLHNSIIWAFEKMLYTFSYIERNTKTDVHTDRQAKKKIQEVWGSYENGIQTVANEHNYGTNETEPS